MKLRLAWTQSGDHFDIVAAHPELAQWYAAQCQRHSSQFKTNIFSQDPTPRYCGAMIDKISNGLLQVNSVLKKLHLETIGTPDNFYDQQQLNQLHRCWIQIDQQYPGLDNLLYRMNPELFDAYNSLNMETHKLESSFNYVLRATKPWREPNPFDNFDFYPGVFNVSICYTDHGRSSWEKFVNYEKQPNDHELSNWKNIGSAISINLVKPYNGEFPKEFLGYCNTHNIAPSYSHLPLGNLPDATELARARQIMDTNLTMPDNCLTIVNI